MNPLTDILTTAKGLVQAVNQLGQTLMKLKGVLRSDPVSNTTGLLVASGSGRLVSASVTVASGSTVASIYDTNVVTALNNLIVSVLPTVGVQQLNIPFTTGLVIVCPSTVTLVLTYSD